MLQLLVSESGSEKIVSHSSAKNIQTIRSKLGARPKGLKLKTRLETLRPESRSGILGRGQRAPSPPARCTGERCKLPSGVLGEAPAASSVDAL